MTARGHLTRLDRVWAERPIYFVTACTLDRRHELASQQLHSICVEVWRNAQALYGWRVGRYVLMPDHVHFFCAPLNAAKPLALLVGKWKEWTAKYAARRLNVATPLWQAEFFDHTLRSHESYEQKWNYVRMNPVRAGLVASRGEWPFQGELNELRYEN